MQGSQPKRVTSTWPPLARRKKISSTRSRCPWRGRLPFPSPPRLSWRFPDAAGDRRRELRVRAEAVETTAGLRREARCRDRRSSGVDPLQEAPFRRKARVRPASELTDQSVVFDMRPLLAQRPFFDRSSRNELETIRTRRVTSTAARDRCAPSAYQPARRHRGFTLPCEPLKFGGDARAVMNNERTDDLAHGRLVRGCGEARPNGPAMARSRVARSPIRLRRRFSTSRMKGPCCDCGTTSPKLRGADHPCCSSTRFSNARMSSTSCPTAASCRAFCVEGLSVYLTDWLPPSDADAHCGLRDYVERELADAVECIRQRERVRRVGLVGCCLGGFVAYRVRRTASAERRASRRVGAAV